MNKRPAIFGAIIEDGFSYIKLPDGAILNASVQAYFDRRDEMSREILIEELEKGKIDKALVRSSLREV